MTLDEIKKLFATHHIEKVKLGGFDVDGVLRGKYISLEKFWSAAEAGWDFATSSLAGTAPTRFTTTSA